MVQHILSSEKFYILSGPSASGKSSLTNQLINQGLTPDSIVSTDTIRKNILGSVFTQDEDGFKESLLGWEVHQKEIFQIIDTILELRFKQKLPTILDATNLNDKDRLPYIQLAKKHGIESQVVIFNVPSDQLKLRLSKRQERFDFSVVEKQLTNFQINSAYDFISASAQDTFILTPNLIPTLKLDIVGDTHGLLSETVQLLSQSGWQFVDNCFIHQDKERKILFLGDILDRGLESIALLKTVKNTVDNHNGYFLLGNHEAKLISSYEQFLKENLVRGKSLSSSQTLMDFLKEDVTEQKQLYDFLKASPTNYCLWVNKNTNNVVNPHDLIHLKNEDLFKIGFGHADIEYFNPYNISFSHALYGKRGNTNDIDQLYERNFESNINNHIYFRGHVLNHSQQNHVYSLEDNQAFAGNLVSLDIEKYIQLVSKNQWQSQYKYFEETIMKQKSEFNYNEHMQENVQLMKDLQQLYKEGLVTDGWRKDEHGNKAAHPDGFKIYKYSKKVHFKRLWKAHPTLEKARGIALDMAGNIIIHPFDKVYNYGEYDAGSQVKPEQKVQVVEKLNGFLGCISKHPFRNELLISTTGSLSSDYIEYIKHFVDETKEKELLSYFKDNKTTLMFEVIHPEDKHIIEYDDKQNGLWLIGARGLQVKDQPFTEAVLDQLGKELNFRRPFWYEAKFGEVLESLQNSELEGFMIRNAEDHEPIMKIKTNYYLVTKFVGRMGPKMVENMFKNPEQFKEQKMDEEFYPIVDKIVKKTTPEAFVNMEQKLRVEFVRNIVNEVRNEFEQAPENNTNKGMKI